MVTEHGSKANAPFQILFFSMMGQLSIRPLTALLAAGMNVVGLVVPAKTLPATLMQEEESPFTAILPPTPETMPLLTPNAPSLLQIAQQHQLPLYAAQDLESKETIDTITDLRPNVIIVSCFSLRIPTNVLEIPTHGALNVHPSLLPKFRGPDPLFWTFRAGELDTGVTIHYMDEGLDTGDIAMQVPVSLPQGVGEPEAEKILAAQAGELLTAAVTRLEEGNLPRRPQVSGGSYQPAPSPADYSISTDWPAQRAYTFMRGTVNRKRPYALASEGQVIFLQTAVFYNESMTLPHPIIWRGNDVLIQMAPGVLRARVAV